VFPQIETVEQEIVSRVIFMQDGAPPHFSCFVTDVLKERPLMPGLEGMDKYPSHLEAQISLHLIFFLWVYIKNIVYTEKIRNI